MLQSKTRWLVANADHRLVKQLEDELQLSPLVATVLINRGIQTVDEARSFLFPEQYFHDPFLLEDMEKCVRRIHEAIADKERIVVYGDYDADGVTATVVLVTVLKQLGARVDYYIPNRFTEGYGPNEAAFRKLKDEGFDLLITVDNGISGIHEAQVAKEIGLDLIITDHHEPGEEIPDAIAVIHPKHPASKYPFKELAGVGVAYKVATALLDEEPEELLPFVAIGTVADLVPLIDENRLLVKKGIEALKTTSWPGLVALIEKAGFQQEAIDEYTIGFGLGPRINAAGRLASARPAAELFLETDPFLVQKLAGKIDELNQRRQAIVDRITAEALEEVKKLDLDHNPVIIVGKEGWHPGVIGIVASRLVEQFYRPTLVFSLEKESGLAKGSARSIEGFNMYENLSRCRDLLENFGGHPMAAGLTLKIDEIPRLYLRMNQQAKLELTPEDLIPVMHLDGVFSIEEITLEAVEQLETLAPFGTGNPKPKILIKDIHFSQMKKVGADQKHLKFTITNQEQSLDGIAFNFGPYEEHISPLAKVSAVGEVNINEWNSIRRPQLVLKDLAIDEWQLFDYRGQNQWQRLAENVPIYKQKWIVFQENTYKMMNGEFPNLTWIRTEEDVKHCNLDESNVIFLDLPPDLSYIEQLVRGKTPLRIYACFYQPENAPIPILPSREQFKKYYLFLHKQGLFDLARHGMMLAKRTGWSLETIRFMTDVFVELQFVHRHGGTLVVEKNPTKRNLEESTVFQNRLRRSQVEKVLIYSSYRELKRWFDQYVGSKLEEERLRWI